MYICVGAVSASFILCHFERFYSDIFEPYSKWYKDLQCWVHTEDFFVLQVILYSQLCILSRECSLSIAGRILQDPKKINILFLFLHSDLHTSKSEAFLQVQTDSSWRCSCAAHGCSTLHNSRWPTFRKLFGVLNQLRWLHCTEYTRTSAAT